MLLELAVIVVFSWVFRLQFVTTSQTSLSNDTMAHLYMVKSQQKHRWLNNNYDKAVLKTIFGYPKLQHYIVSRFPEERWLQVGTWAVLFYDVFTVALFYLLVSHYVPGDVGTGSVAFWASMLFSTTPVLFAVPARLGGVGNARTFGMLQIFVMLIAWYMIGSSNIPAFFAVTLLTMLIIIYSSSFGLQAAIAFAVVISVLTTDPVPALSVFASIAVLYVLPVGARQVLVHKFQHWVWYFRNRNVGTLPGIRNRWSDVKALPEMWNASRARFMQVILTRLTPTIFLYTVPMAPVILYFQVTGGLVINDTFTAYAQTVFWAGLITFALISIRVFSFVGEAERYMEYSAPFQALLYVLLVQQGALPGIALPAMLALHLTFAVMVFRFRNRQIYKQSTMKSLVTPPVREVYVYLRDLKPEMVSILTIPTKHAFFWSFVLYRLKHVKLYQVFMGSDNGFAAMQSETKQEDFNMPVENLTLFKERYGINRVLVQKANAKRTAKIVADYGLDSSIMEYENDEFILFKI